MKGSNASGQKSVLAAVRAIIIGALSGAACSIILLIICTFAFVSSENIPHDFLSAFIIGISLISSLFAGFVTAKISRQRGLIFGSMAGLLLFLLLLIAGFAISQSDTGSGAFLRLILMLLSGGIGGLIAVNGKSRRK